MRGTRTRLKHGSAGFESGKSNAYIRRVKRVGENIFDGFKSKNSLFLNKEILRHSYTPESLPHRDQEIQSLSYNLVEALHGQIPSNMILYGLTGQGKTATTNFVCSQLEEKGQSIGKNVSTLIVNCRQIDTQYRVLAHMGNSLLQQDEIEIPFTGWPNDRVLFELSKRMDNKGGVFIIVLDEIDHLVKKAGDDILYNLTNMNSTLKNSRACVIGISNDLKFTDYLDPRVRSRLGQLDVLFKPYSAGQLQDILRNRASAGLKQGIIKEGVIELCSAIAAQEQGDARCALDLLRVSAEMAERDNSEFILQQHVRTAHNQIEADQIIPTIQSLPAQQKLVLSAILLNERFGMKNIKTGAVYDIYKQACRFNNQAPVTQRHVSGLISNLDMLGLINAKKVFKGRGGATKEINSCIPANVDPIEVLSQSDEVFEELFKKKYNHQGRL